MLQQHLINVIKPIPHQISQQSLPTRVLFLVTIPPELIVATWPPYQNPFLPQLIREWGAVVDVRSWRDHTLYASTLA